MLVSIYILTLFQNKLLLHIFVWKFVFPNYLSFFFTLSYPNISFFCQHPLNSVCLSASLSLNVSPSPRSHTAKCFEPRKCPTNTSTVLIHPKFSPLSWSLRHGCGKHCILSPLLLPVQRGPGLCRPVKCAIVTHKNRSFVSHVGVLSLPLIRGYEVCLALFSFAHTHP